VTAVAGEKSEKKTPLAAIADVGAAGQAVVPGVYAWAVTVVPAAWSRASNIGVQIAALLALVALLQTLRKPAEGTVRTSSVGVWVFVLACTVVWVCVPSALAPAHLHPARGVAGMLGWGVFAFAAAAPALGASRSGPAPEGGLKPRLPIARGDAIYVGAAIALAAALQAVGWSITVPERAVLVRIVTLASGIAIIGAATTLTTSRHAAPVDLRRALRSALPMLLCIALLVLTGAAYTLSAP
jgi:hypothetical protein